MDENDKTVPSAGEPDVTAEGSPANGSHQVITGDDGVYLKVFPPQNGGNPVQEPTIISELKTRNIRQYDMALVMKTIREATGVSVKIADLAREDAEPEIQVLVDRDRMTASLTIIIPKDSRPLAYQEVLDKIALVGVTHGLDQEAIKRAFDHPGAKAVIAQGTPAANGTDARIQYYVEIDRKGRPHEMEDGRVDFKDLDLFTIVAEGDLLAEKIPQTPGEPGMDVLGQVIPAKSGRDMPLPAGKNVQAEDNKIFAAISGQLQFSNNKIHVSPLIEIKNDVDLSTGNIEFVGNVIVRGSVQTGFYVKAQGNVEIYGSVCGGVVEGQNIVVKTGIQGMHRGYVKAVENVTTKFIENATVSADGDVLVNDVILHSQVNAGKRVIVEGRRGFIAGGHVVAAEEIRAKIVGTQMAVATDLEVGVNPTIRAENLTLRKQLRQAEASLDQAQKALSILKAMNQNELPPEKRELLLKLTKSQFLLTGQVEAMKKRSTEIEVLLEEMRYCRIKVADMIYPGVKIVIGTLVKPIRETQKFVSFFAEDGEIRTGSFR